jgi:hypothetical protein
VFAPPTAAPSIVKCAFHELAVAVFAKYTVAVCAAPSESYTVTAVE